MATKTRTPKRTPVRKVKPAAKKIATKKPVAKKKAPVKMTPNPKLENLTIHYQTSISDKPYFNLHAANGQIVATSEMYSTEQARNKTAEMLCANFESCRIKDEFNRYIS